MTTQTSAAIGLILILATHASATDWIVGPVGSGAPFNSIQSAVNAAQPGDRVLVLPGSYDGTVLVDKAIEIIGSGSSAVTLRGWTSSIPGALPPMRVTGVAAGSRARVSGMTLTILGVPMVPLEYLLRIDECTGVVELSDLVLLGAGLPVLPTLTRGFLYVKNCSQVAASGVQSIGWDYAGLGGHFGVAPTHALAGAVVENSAILMTDSTAVGNASTLPSLAWGGDGGDGIRLINSTAQIARSVIRGAPSAGHLSGVAGAGGHGIRAEGSVVVIHGGVGNATSGANAFELTSYGLLMLGTAGSAVSLDGSSSLVYGVDVVLSGGTGTTSLPPATPLDLAAGSMVDARAERIPTVSITPASASLGSLLTVRLSGEPGVGYIRAVALRTMSAVGIPGALGAVVADLSTVLIWHFDTLDPTGNLTTSVTVPLDPSLAGVGIVEQCAQALPTGIVISPPLMITLVP